MKPSRSTFIELRAARHHVREWGDPDAPALFMLHGFADVSATFQFVVDAFAHAWHVVAPDLRGFGLSCRGADAYWYPDYLGDLDALLAHYSPEAPARLAGHSMGGNIASIYAGVRPDRVSALVALEAFGLPDRAPHEAPRRLEKWLSQLCSPPSFRSYDNVDAFARRMMQDNPRLDLARATFLASHLTEADGRGGVRVAAERGHRNINPVLYRRAEAESCWRHVRAPVLWIVQADGAWRRSMGLTDDVYDATKACFADLREVALDDCGHNLQHDQPERVAATIEDFLLS